MTHETTHDHPFIAEAIAQYARLDIGQRMRPQPGKSVLITHPGGRNVEVRTADHLLASFRVVGDDASGYLELSAVRKDVPHKPSIIVDSPRSVRLPATSPTARTTAARTTATRPRSSAEPLDKRVAKLRHEIEALKAARSPTPEMDYVATAASSPPRPSPIVERRLDEVFGMYASHTASVVRNGTSVSFGYRPASSTSRRATSTSPSSSRTPTAARSSSLSAEARERLASADRDATPNPHITRTPTALVCSVVRP
jgi:hypothetical protein